MRQTTKKKEKKNVYYYVEKQSSAFPVQVELVPVQFTRALPVQVKQFYPSSECETRATVQREREYSRA